MKNGFDELKKTVRSYADHLPDKIAEIEALLNNFMSHRKAEDLAALRLKIHNIHGSAATFGYPKLSAIAMKLNQQLPLSMQDTEPLPDKQIKMIYTLIKELKSTPLKPEIDLLEKIAKR